MGRPALRPNQIAGAHLLGVLAGILLIVGLASALAAPPRLILT